MDAYAIPEELRYTASHLWVRRDGDVAVVGLTEHGQERHGRILFVGLPAVGSPAEFGMPLGYLQSAGYGLTQLFPPVQGDVIEINDRLWANPTLINDSPQDEGWLVKIRMADASDLDELDTAADYRAALQGERQATGFELPSHFMERTEPVFLIDERRRILSCNSAAESLIGLSRREMQHGPLCRELFGCHMHDDQPIGRSNCPGLCSMMNLEPVSETYTVTNARGEQTHVTATYTPLSEPGQPRRAVVVVTSQD